MPKSMPPLPTGSQRGGPTSQVLPVQQPNEVGSSRGPEVTERQELIAGSPFGNPLGSARPLDGRTNFDSTLDPTISSDQLGAWVTGVTPARRSLSEQCGPVEP